VNSMDCRTSLPHWKPNKVKSTQALADGSLYAIDNVRALKLATRNSAIDDELMAALERWEVLGRPA
jgi:hypothetical protein